MPVPGTNQIQHSEYRIGLRYFGHSAFELVSPAGFRVLIDPFRNVPDQPWFLFDFPVTETDLLLVTHDHFDHDAIDRVTGWFSMLRGAGHLKVEDLTVDGYVDLHTPGHSSASLKNTSFLIDCAGIRFLHTGDNRVPVPEEIVQAVGRVDVLTVPVDGSCHLLEYDQVHQLIDQFQPGVVLPVHYYIDGLTTVESTLLPADDWLSTQTNVRVMGSDRIAIGASDLPDRQEIWLLEPQVRL